MSITERFTRSSISRRALLGGMAALGAASTLPRAAFGQDVTTVTWWDVYQPLIPLHEAMWADFAANHPGRVEYTGMNPSDMMQALQLANRSNQMPDVFNVPAGVDQVNALQATGWFSPLADSFSFDKPFQQEVLAEGFTTFGGELYSFPIFSFRQTSTSLWYFKDGMEAAGIDPATGPQTWDEVRAAAKAATKDGKYGIILPLQFIDRMAAHLNDLAQAAGAAGPIDWKTGEYAYATQPYLDALNFLLGLQQDGSLHPASSSLDARQGRARWAAGEALMFLDGPWNSGVLNGNFKEVIDGIDVARVPYPSAAAGQSYVYRGPQAGTFFISSQSNNVEMASQVLQQLTSEEYYIGLAERMDQPPLDLSSVQKANVHPTYRKVVTGYADYVRLAPDPLIRNPAVAQVYAQMRPVTPGLGEIIQGAFAGAFSDPAPVLQQFSDQMTAERKRAVDAVVASGGAVSVDDWKFDAWTPGEDFTADKY